MKYVDIRGTQEVISVSITFPELSPLFKYYYPDGIEKGWIRKKTYFVSSPSRNTYYQTPQDAIKGEGGDLFVKDGKIWITGKVKISLKSIPEEHTYLRFTDTEILETFLDNLYEKCGIDPSALVCLETPHLLSLYEYKSIGFRNLD